MFIYHIVLGLSVWANFWLNRLDFGRRVEVEGLRLKDSCSTQPQAQGPDRTCNENKEEVKKKVGGEDGGPSMSRIGALRRRGWGPFRVENTGSSVLRMGALPCRE